MSKPKTSSSKRRSRPGQGEWTSSPNPKVTALLTSLQERGSCCHPEKGYATIKLLARVAGVSFGGLSGALNSDEKGARIRVRVLRYLTVEEIRGLGPAWRVAAKKEYGRNFADHVPVHVGASMMRSIGVG